MQSPSVTGIVLSILLSLALSPLEAQLHKPEPNLPGILDSAQRCLQHGNSQKARAYLTAAIREPMMNPGERAYAFLLLGEVEETEGFSAKAAYAFRQSVQYAKEVGADSVEAYAWQGIANAQIGRGQYDSALQLLEKSILLNSSQRSQLAHHLVAARYWQSLNEYDKALSFFQQAYDLAVLLKDTRSTGLALSGIGGVYFSQDPDINKARGYFLKAIALFDSAKHANLLARNYARMANVNMVKGNGKEASSYLLRAKAITDISGNLPIRSYVLSSLAILAAGEGNLEQAIRYGEEPLHIKRSLGQHKQLQNDLLNYSEWYMDLKRFDQARMAITEGLETSNRLKDVVYLHYFYERLARLDSLTGNYRHAYTHLKRSMFYKDSVVNLKRIKALEEIREKYETGQKEKVIAEKELVIEQQKFQQTAMLGGSVIIVLIMIVTLITIRIRHKNKLLVTIEKQNQVRLQTIVATQEEVQQSIARDLHDGLIQVLGAAKMALQAIHPNTEATQVVNHVRTASSIIDEACAEARTISHQLLPYSLTQDGLVAALEELFRKSLVQYTFNKPLEPIVLQEEVSITAFRIVQEAINNILKHAEASRVSIDLRIDNNQLMLTIKDDGKGFDVNQARGGAGLTNMATRAQVIQGKIDIQSTPQGTVLKVTAPLERHSIHS